MQPLEVLKWIGVVFAAGFVGYFGRYLSMLIIERMHRKKPGQTTSEETAKGKPVAQVSAPEAAQIKIEKKRAKAEAKKAKKQQKG